jgi:hypothetical protein
MYAGTKEFLEDMLAKGGFHAKSRFAEKPAVKFGKKHKCKSDLA